MINRKTVYGYSLIKSVSIGVALVASSSAFGITIGSSSTGNCMPFNCNDSGTSSGLSVDYYQTYDSSAFSGPTAFNTVSFFDYQPFPTVPARVINGNYAISFGTTLNPVNTPFSSIAMSNVTPFFSGSLSGLPVNGLFSISGNLINYDPSAGNLLMHVMVTDQELIPNGSGNGYFQAGFTSLTARSYALANGGTGFNDTGLRTDFSLSQSTSAVPEPASWAMMIAGFGLAGTALRNQRKPNVRMA